MGPGPDNAGLRMSHTTVGSNLPAAGTGISYHEGNTILMLVRSGACKGIPEAKEFTRRKVAQAKNGNVFSQTWCRRVLQLA